MTYPDMWGQGTALVAITASGGSDIDFTANISSIDIDMGDKEYETIPTTRGGRLEKRIPEADTIITFEAYMVHLNTNDATTGNAEIIQRFFTTRTNWDTSEDYNVTNSRNRDKFRVVILWTENTTATSATATSPASSEALRFIANGARLVSVKPTFTDNELKFTFKFRVSPYTSSGTGNLQWQATSGTTTLNALAAYT